jgi:hypothetical protein
LYFFGFMAGPTRFELATSGVTGRRSNQLNYDPARVREAQTVSGSTLPICKAPNNNSSNALLQGAFMKEITLRAPFISRYSRHGRSYRV